MQAFRRRVARWAIGPKFDLISRLHEAHAKGEHAEIVIGNGKIWVNIDGRCEFRGVAKEIEIRRLQ